MRAREAPVSAVSAPEKNAPSNSRTTITAIVIHITMSIVFQPAPRPDPNRAAA